MFARIEVATRPEFPDSAAQLWLRKIELFSPEIRKKIRWARFLDVYWMELQLAREEVIPLLQEVCWDPVLQWMFTGNLMPAAAGKQGSLQDLMEAAASRPGKFWGIERRFRAGVTDPAGRTLLEAFEIAQGNPMTDARSASGGLLLLEGSELSELELEKIALGVFCNELVETWTLLSEEDLKKNERFHQERVKYDLPKINLKSSDSVEQFALGAMDLTQALGLSQKKLWALDESELKAIQEYFANSVETKRRAQSGLSDPTDVEMEIIAQTWSEHCKHKIFRAEIHYQNEGASEVGNEIPKRIDGLFRETVSRTTEELNKPWILSAFEDNAGICVFDEDDAFCVKVETHNSPSALDPYGGALTGIGGVNRDILGTGIGAKPIFNTNVFCVANPDFSDSLPERLLHPRRILDGIRRGVEHGGNKTGIPTVNGALVFDNRYLGKPLVYCGSGGLMPRKIRVDSPVEEEILSHLKEVRVGDRVCMIGGRVGKDGIHGATFSSLHLGDDIPSSVVQMGDPFIQKRMTDFILEARDLGLFRAITDNGAGGLSSSVGEMARLSQGATIDLSLVPTKYPGLKPFELMVSESQERMTVAVPPEKWDAFANLAARRNVEVSNLGQFTDSERLEVFYGEKCVANLDLEFLHQGVPQLVMNAEWKASPAMSIHRPEQNQSRDDFKVFQEKASATLLELLGRPNIASKEWLIRQYDHEVQGTSVIKPLHTVATNGGASTGRTGLSGPNDSSVIRPKLNSDRGLVVGSGILPRYSDFDPYVMAQASVDEAIRNVLCVGTDYGSDESILSLCDNFCWPDPIGDSRKTAELVRACYGMRNAALELSVPLISGKDSMKNDYKGMHQGKPVQISVPPTLLMTAVGVISDIKKARTSDFKNVGDAIYLLGPGEFELLGSEYYSVFNQTDEMEAVRLPSPQWEIARRLYSWLGGSLGKESSLLRSIHDVSEGGLLTSVAESLIARGLGATLTIPAYETRSTKGLMAYCFGEGFHSFVASVSESSRERVESEWKEFGIPFQYLGAVKNLGGIEIHVEHPDFMDQRDLVRIGMDEIRQAWMKEGYWE